jgi:hypothetical protein
LDPNKLNANIYIDIQVAVAEEKCYFTYCYCSNDNKYSSQRSYIAEELGGTDNITGSDLGPYALTAYVSDRCGGKGVTSWHGVGIDGRFDPIYYDGKLFIYLPGGIINLNENNDPIYKLRGGCGPNNDNCGARPGERL